MHDITASIVVYRNPPAMLTRVFSDFLLTKLDVKLFVVDNSPDDSIEPLCRDTRIEYIHVGQNKGFGAGHNIAIRKAMNTSKYHIILNPDVYFDYPIIEELYTFACQHEDIGLIMPKVLYPDGSLQYLCKLLPAPIDVVFRGFSPFFGLKNRRDETFELRFSGYNSIMDIPYLSGCFMFIKTQVFLKVGLFDERFFLHFEDLDLTRRIHRHFRTVFYPHVSIYHEFAKESRRNKRVLWIQICSAVKYFNKWGWFFDSERNKVNREVLEKALKTT